MPANLLSFCLASTYDVLPSPSNLKWWRICTESSCFLCSKEICTTAHVLGACKVSLTQGRFTFRHDSVLSELASILSSFIKALPQSSCFLCSKEICTTAHVLGACKVSLTQGRFTFRHDSVLSELASILSSFIKALPPTPPKISICESREKCVKIQG